MTDNSRYPSLLIKKGWVEKLDKSAIPNIKNLEPTLQHPNLDPNRDYSLPWQSGHHGDRLQRQAHRSRAHGPRPARESEAQGQDHSPEGVGDTMHLDDGGERRRPEKVTECPWDAAFKASRRPSTPARSGNSPGTTTRAARERRPRRGDAWSGDVVQIGGDNKHLHWNVPTDGGGIWTDNMLIPKGGNVYTASVYMNYYYDPKVPRRRSKGHRRQLHLPGRSARRRCCSRKTLRSRRTR